METETMTTVTAVNDEKETPSFFSFMEKVIDDLKQMGRQRTSDAYRSALNSFKRFRGDMDILLKDVDADTMQAYESFLRDNAVSPNSSSFYMRNLRAVYNRAVEKGLITQKFPFRRVYTGIDKTKKRAIAFKFVRQLKELDLAQRPALQFARDMFLFSFYTRGMSYVDIAFLRKKDLKRGILTYRRRKTGQQLSIKWEKCMQEIVKRYARPQSPFLLPVINLQHSTDVHQQYLYSSHNVNHNLKLIGQELKIPIPLTMYVARHTWASVAKNQNIPLSVISESMGHDSESTTRIYLSSLDTTVIDEANRMILNMF